MEGKEGTAVAEGGAEGTCGVGRARPRPPVPRAPGADAGGAGSTTRAPELASGTGALAAIVAGALGAGAASPAVAVSIRSGATSAVGGSFLSARDPA